MQATTDPSTVTWTDIEKVGGQLRPVRGSRRRRRRRCVRSKRDRPARCGHALLGGTIPAQRRCRRLGRDTPVPTKVHRFLIELAYQLGQAMGEEVEGGLSYRTTSRIDAAHVALGEAIAEWKESLGHPQLDEYSEFADQS
jgi:hypothetical protein